MYRHIRGNANRDVLDFRYAGTFGRNRWNEPDEPTLYLAGDPGVLVAEWGRQIRESFTDDVATQTIIRDVYRLRAHLNRVIDLRNSETALRFGVSDITSQFADRTVARSTAALVRSTTDTQGLLVPSIAFLDDLTRWNLVVFLERVPDDSTSWIHQVERIGPLRWN